MCCLGVFCVCLWFWLLCFSSENSASNSRFILSNFQLLTDNVSYSIGNAGKKRVHSQFLHPDLIWESGHCGAPPFTSLCFGYSQPIVLPNLGAGLDLGKRPLRCAPFSRLCLLVFRDGVEGECSQKKGKGISREVREALVSVWWFWGKPSAP